jgi:phage terminase large subunit-like protein
LKDIELVCREGIPGYDPWGTAADGEWFDVDLARVAVRYFEKQLTHVKGEKAGEPFKLERWQVAMVGNTFGWRRADGTRRYREVFVYVPRKNGKTTLVAGILLYGLFEDGESGAEIYGAASEYKQASLVFEHARGMVMWNPRYRPSRENGIKVYEGQAKAIQLGEETGWATYRVISRKDDAAHGFSVHMAAIDELHTQPDGRLVEALMTGTGGRRQPLVVYMTTADYMRESICNQKYEYANQVRQGIIRDSRFLPVVWEALGEDDWTDPATWEKANPNIGVSVKREYLERECKRAQDSPAYENTFKRLHLNIRTEQDVRWLQMVRWDACGGDIDPGKLRGKKCYAGLDLSSTTDITALCLLFPEQGNAVLPFFWIPEANARERERRDRVPYVDWARRGLIEMTPGNVVDQGFIRKRINELKDDYEIVEVAADPWNSVQLQTDLTQDGFEVVAFRQGFASMSSPTKELETLVLAENLRHGAHEVLRWMAANVSVDMDPAGNMKPSKKASTERIDGIVALIMAIGRATLAIQKGPSVYEDRGVLVL